VSAVIGQFILMLALPTLLIYACFSDLFAMKISNRLCLAVVGVFPIFALAVGMPIGMAAWHVLAGLLVLVVSFTLFSFGWIGGGDAKFVAAASLWLGFSQLWEYVAVSSILGGALTLAILGIRGYPLPAPLLRLQWVNKLHDKKTGIPYGIALGVSAVLLLPHAPVWLTAF
jgi:prepilin peptidase CpaA